MEQLSANVSRCLLLSAIVLLGGSCGGSSLNDDAGSPETSPRNALGAPADADAQCDVALEAPGEVRAGDRSRATVTLSTARPWKVNEDAPLTVEVTSSDVELHETRLGFADSSAVSANAITMQIPFTPHAEGQSTIEIHARYGVCNDHACDICRGQRLATTTVN